VHAGCLLLMMAMENAELTKKALGGTQTLRAGCSKAEQKIFASPQTPYPGA